MTRREQPEQNAKQAMRENMTAYRAATPSYTRINVIEREHAHPDCGCTLVRDEGGRVSLYQCATHEQAPAMLELVKRAVATLSTNGRNNSEERLRDLAIIARAILRAIDGA